MEELLPKLFILSAEASIVLFLILVLIIIFNSKAKRKDIKAAEQLISRYVNRKEERIASIKNHFDKIAFDNDTNELAEKLYNQEKLLLKEFITLYLRRDTRQLIKYPETVMAVDDDFLKSSISASEATETSIPPQEQTESNNAHLKELQELRLKNTELNEHLFEALATITTLVTEHGKKTDQEVVANSQKILEAIIYLRDNRLGIAKAPGQLDDPWTAALADQEKPEKT